MSAALEISIASPQLEGLQARIRRLAAGMADPSELLEAVGAELESQTRRRIESGGPDPDGEPWQDWSDAYAKTRRGGQSLLRADGGLLDSIQSLVSGHVLETGSNLAYAAIQQFGGTSEMPAGPRDVPARAWLGISADDARELDQLISDHFENLAEALA